MHTFRFVPTKAHEVVERHGRVGKRVHERIDWNVHLILDANHPESIARA